MGLKPLVGHFAKIGLGLALLIAAACIDYRRWMQWSTGLYLLALLALSLVLVPGIGSRVNGARRWFQFDALPFAVQPSEFAKLAVILGVATYVTRTSNIGKSFGKTFLPAALLILVPASLILVETDLGTFLLVSMMGFVLLQLAGMKLQHLLWLSFCALPMLVYLVIEKLDYVVARFTGYGDPDPSSQVGFGLSALSAGGVTGVGLGGGRTKLFFLAEAENDFILSVVGEELGFIGTTAVVLLFTTLLWSGGRILLGIHDRFGFFVVAGVLLTIATQALINLAVATGCVPVKGMPLPFVSAGGSSLTALCLAVGIVISVARHSARSPAPPDWAMNAEGSSE